MYWIIGKIIASILVTLFVMSPFVRPLRRKYLTYDWFEETLMGRVYTLIENKEVDSTEKAFEIMIMTILLLVMGVIGWFSIVLIYPVLIIMIVVMWTLKRLYSK